MAHTWTDRPNPLDGGYGWKSLYVPQIPKWFMGGSDFGSVSLVFSVDEGASWADAASNLTSFVADIDYSPSQSVIVAAGQGSGSCIDRSDDDGATWVAQTTPFDGGYVYAVKWIEELSLWVAGGYDNGGAGGAVIMTSPDAITWTAVSTPFDNGYLADLTFALGNVVAVGNDSVGTACVMTSPDAVTFTSQATPADGPATTMYGVGWAPTHAVVIVTGYDGIGGIVAMSSPDTAAWSQVVTPWDGLGANGYDVTEVGGGEVLLVGYLDGTQSVLASPDLSAWEVNPNDFDDGGGAYGVGWAPEIEEALVTGYNADDSITALTAHIENTPAVAFRFFQGYPWRFLFADIPSYYSGGGVTTTWADGLLTSRGIVFTLDQPTVITAAVWPDDRRVNQIFALDGDPLVAQGNRIVYCFRREGGNPPWKIRAAGILMSPEDQGDADIPLTHFTAYDPWLYLYARPVMNADGNLPPPDGAIVILRGDQIVTSLLKHTIDNQGFCFIDAGVAFGGTSYYSGTIEATDVIAFEYQRGMTVGDAWDAMCNAGNLDIELKAIYDPRRPGYTHELNIKRLAGVNRRTAVFAWDKMNRSVTTIDRMHDGTPGNFINVIQAYAGQGGFPVPAAGPLKNNASVLKYLPYWLNTFQTTQGAVDPTGSMVLALAQQQLVLQKQGRRTLTLSPTPERAPIPLTEYNVGDRVPVYATRRLRVTAAGLQRVQAIPISIDDDGIESVPALLTSPDWRQET